MSLTFDRKIVTIYIYIYIYNCCKLSLSAELTLVLPILTFVFTVSSQTGCPDDDSSLTPWAPPPNPLQDVVINGPGGYLLTQSTALRTITIQNGGRYGHGCLPVGRWRSVGTLHYHRAYVEPPFRIECRQTWKSRMETVSSTRSIALWMTDPLNGSWQTNWLIISR